MPSWQCGRAEPSTSCAMQVCCSYCRAVEISYVFGPYRQDCSHLISFHAVSRVSSPGQGRNGFWRYRQNGSSGAAANGGYANGVHTRDGRDAALGDDRFKPARRPMDFQVRLFARPSFLLFVPAPNFSVPRQCSGSPHFNRSAQHRTSLGKTQDRPLWHQRAISTPEFLAITSH